MISKKQMIRDILVVGFALFAMFLGAGNLIFPPTLGHLAGSKWGFALLGFFVTGVGMPILGIISVGISGGRLDDFTKNMNQTFSVFFLTFVMLIIGPLFAIPRTAATTYEIAIQPLNMGISSVTASFIFFAITLFFVLTPNNVIDRVGKFLTPILIVVLGLLIIKSIITPIGTASQPYVDNIFLRGFKEGYQTMDALGSIILATIIISGIKTKGYSDKKDVLKLTLYTGLVACVGLALVYGGLVYLGATGNAVLPEKLSRTQIVVQSTMLLWGRAGQMVLGLSIGLACLTTAIGLTTTAGEFFSEKFKNDISYRAAVIIVSSISFLLANFGVDAIIRFAGPILEVVYPVAIVLIVLNIFGRFLPNPYFFHGAIVGTLSISLLQGVVSAKDLINSFLLKIHALPTMNTEALSFNATIKMLKGMPFNGVGMPWLLPAFAVSLVFGFASILLKKTEEAPSMNDSISDTSDHD